MQIFFNSYFNTPSSFKKQKNTQSFKAAIPKNVSDITKTQIETCIKQGMSVKSIAEFLNIRLNALYKAMEEFNIMTVNKQNRLNNQKSMHILNSTLPKMLAKNADLFEMAQATGVDQKKIISWIAERTNKSFKETRYKMLQDLFKKNYNKAQIAELLGIKEHTVKRMKYNLGVFEVVKKDKKVEMIKQMLSSGMYPKEIAQKLDMAVCTIYMYMKEYKLKNLISEYQKKTILERSKQGLSLSAIAKELRIDRASIARFVDKHELKQEIMQLRNEYNKSIASRVKDSSLKTVAGEMNLSHCQIKYRLKKAQDSSNLPQ